MVSDEMVAAGSRSYKFERSCQNFMRLPWVKTGSCWRHNLRVALRLPWAIICSPYRGKIQTAGTHLPVDPKLVRWQDNLMQAAVRNSFCGLEGKRLHLGKQGIAR